MSDGSAANRSDNLAATLVKAGRATPTQPTVHASPRVRDSSTRCAHTASRVDWGQSRASSRSRTSSNGTGRDGRSANSRPLIEIGFGPVVSNRNAVRAVCNGEPPGLAGSWRVVLVVGMDHAPEESSEQGLAQHATPALTSRPRRDHRMLASRWKRSAPARPRIVGDHHDACADSLPPRRAMSRCNRCHGRWPGISCRCQRAVAGL